MIHQLLMSDPALDALAVGSVLVFVLSACAVFVGVGWLMQHIGQRR